MAWRRALSGAKNAAFYGTTTKINVIPGYIFRWINNLHRLESPAWYAQFGAMFFFVLAFSLKCESPVDATATARALFFLKHAGIAMLATMSASSIASPFFQGFINQSTGEPFTDRQENPKSEFVLGIISFWWPRPWKGYVRWFSMVGGIAGSAAAIYLLFFA